MSGSLGELVVSIRADIARFQSDMGKMQKSAQDSADRISRSLGGLDGAIKKVGSAFAALGIGLSAAALTSWVKGAIDAADELAKMSQRVGLTVQELAKLNYAGSLADVSMEQLGKGLKQLSKNMVEAAGGSKEQAAAFRALGVEFRNADGSMRKVPEVFSDIAEKVSLLDDGAVKTAISMKVFGKSGADLIPLLNSGAKGLQEMSAEAERLGLVIDERTAKAAENFNDNLTRLQSSGKGLAFAISEVMLPPLVQLTDELNRVAQADNKWLKIIGYMQTIIKLQTNPLSYVWDPLAGAKKKPGSISDIAGGVAGAAAGAAGQIKAGKTKSELALERYLKSLETPTKSGRSSGAASKAEAEAKRIAALNERIQEQIARASKDQLALIDLESAKYLKEGADRILIEKWVATEKDKINTEAMKGAWKKLEDSQKERVEFEKERAQQINANTLAEISNKMSLVDIEEQYYKLTAGEAAAKRITLLGEQLALHEKIRDEVVGFGPEAQSLRLQEQKEIDGINARLLEQNKIITDRTAMGGFTNALNDYIEAARNMGAQIQEATTNAFKNMEDALVDFVTTGKLNFSNLVDSIIADLARMTIRQNITGPLASGLSSALSGWFGSGVNIDTWGGLPGGLLGGYASGTNYVPETGPYLLHKGEAVIPAAHNSGGLTINVPVSVAGNNALASDLRNEIERTVIDVVRRHS